MGSKSNTFENDLLLLIFNNTDIGEIGDTAGVQNSAAAGKLYIALHSVTAIDDASANQTTNEISYTGYARIGVDRASGAGGWTVSTNSVTNASEVLFGEMTAGTGGLVKSFSIGTLVSGAGKILYWGAVSPEITITNGVTPRFAAGAITVTED